MAVDATQLANAKASLASVFTGPNLAALNTAVEQLKLAKVPSRHIADLEEFVDAAKAIKKQVDAI